MTNPTVVFVPGAWPLIEFFHPITQALEERSHPAVCEITPVQGNTTQDEPYVNPDTKFLREGVVTPLVEAGKDVVLVMHSYGGVYGPASVEGLSKKERSANGKPGGIIALIFVAAFVAPKGASAMDAMGFDPENLPDWAYHDKSTGLVKFVKAREMVFHDLPDEEAERLAQALPGQPYASLSTPNTYDPFNDPAFKGSFGYIFAEADRIVPLVAQQAFAQTVGVTEKVTLQGSSHSPHIERPGELADAIISLTKMLA